MNAVVGCRCRWRPTAGPPMPERSSGAGDSSEPQATTTRRARTVSPDVVRTPAATPPATSTRSARLPTTTRPPAARPAPRAAAPRRDGVVQVRLAHVALGAGPVAEANVAGRLGRVAC